MRQKIKVPVRHRAKTAVQRHTRNVKLRYSLIEDDGSEATGSIDGRSRAHIIKMVRAEAQEWADEQDAPVSYVITDYDGNDVDEDTLEPRGSVGGKKRSAPRKRCALCKRLIHPHVVRVVDGKSYHPGCVPTRSTKPRYISARALGRKIGRMIKDDPEWAAEVEANDVRAQVKRIKRLGRGL
jgi:hypothetical protein